MDQWSTERDENPFVDHPRWEPPFAYMRGEERFSAPWSFYIFPGSSSLNDAVLGAPSPEEPALSEVEGDV